jgi:hypothetical protein
VHLAGRADGKLADCRIRGSAEYGIRVTGDALLRATALPSRSSRTRCTAEHRWAAAASSPATCASPARGDGPAGRGRQPAAGQWLRHSPHRRQRPGRQNRGDC